MPYKLEGKTVFVWRFGTWKVLKTHETVAKAAAHFRALKANVKH